MIPGPRRRYIDWARGLAVLIMIEAHTLDAWTRLADRSTTAYKNLIVLAGFAAPLFLWLAGLSAVFTAERALERTGDRRAAAALVCRRGLEVFILAFLFRLQAFIVSPGSSLLGLFRVDILNVMGPLMVVVGLIWLAGRTRTRLTVTFIALTVLISAVTPPLRSAVWVKGLPIWFQWYLRPFGEHTVFTLFPWGAFAMAGAALGMVLYGVSQQYEQRLHFVLATSGIGLVVIGFVSATLPTLYREASPWTASPSFFAVRLGVITVALSALYWLDMALAESRVLAPLGRLGRASLFVYWIHVELVYGYASWPLRRHLPLPYAVAAFLAFSLLMYFAVVLRDRFAYRRRTRTTLQDTRTPLQA